MNEESRKKLKEQVLEKIVNVQVDNYLYGKFIELLSVKDIKDDPKAYDVSMLDSRIDGIKNRIADDIVNGLNDIDDVFDRYCQGEEINY